MPKKLNDIEWLLKSLGLDYQLEYKFSNKRKFRFDIALTDYKIAIEYEGLQSKKSRHTTSKGYTGDCTKYNLAQIEGWLVLRYTALSKDDIYKDLKEAIKVKQHGESN